MNRAIALPDDDIIVVNPEVMKEMDENQKTDENMENKFADFCAEFFGPNLAIESTHL